MAPAPLIGQETQTAEAQRFDAITAVARDVGRTARCEVAVVDEAVALREWRATVPDADLRTVGALRPRGDVLVVGWTLGHLATRYSPQALARDLCTPLTAFSATGETDATGPLASRLRRAGTPAVSQGAQRPVASVAPVGTGLPRQMRVNRAAMVHASEHLPTGGLTLDEADELMRVIRFVADVLIAYDGVPIQVAVLRTRRGALRVETSDVNGATERLRAALRLMEPERGEVIAIGANRR